MTTRLVATALPTDPGQVAELLAQPPTGADYIELRLDALAEATPTHVIELLKLPRAIPVVATCMAGTRPPEERRKLWIAAAQAGAEVLDVEDTALEELGVDLPGERIASCHLSHFVPRLPMLAQRLVDRGTRFAKLAVPADTPVQLAELLDLQENLPGHFAVVPTGRLAEAGRVMVAGRGAALCYSAVDGRCPGHPDQPPLHRMHDVFHVETVTESTRFYAVVGNPVAHSLSPAYHNAVFRGLGVDARMVALPSDGLHEVLAMADALHLDGLAVTHPLKREALELAASVLPGARTTGSANTLLRTPAGWQARNTDWRAACDLLPRALRRWGRSHRQQTPRVLLLGSGGAARAIAVSLFDQDVELAIWSRRHANARALVAALSDTLAAVALPDPQGFAADLLVNATPVGMPGTDPGALNIGRGNFRPGAIAFDLAYGGPSSIFRDVAREAGAQLTTGEDFFYVQARRQAELFTGAALGAALQREAARLAGSTA